MKGKSSLQEVEIYTETIPLQGLLKWAFGLSGGMAKQLIQEGQVMVNGQRESRRSKQIVPGDVVEVAGVGQIKVVRQDGG